MMLRMARAGNCGKSENPPVDWVGLEMLQR